MNDGANNPNLGPNNSYLVKRKAGGGSQFSRDPLSLTNKHSRKVEIIAVSIGLQSLTVAAVCRICQ